MKRTHALRLVLLTSMPVMLAACTGRTVYDRYTRATYPNMQACLDAYRAIPNFTDPCLYDDGAYHGPYTYNDGVGYVYHGYSGRRVSSYGARYDLKTRAYSTFQDLDAARVLSDSGTKRGGFGKASRSRSYGG